MRTALFVAMGTFLVPAVTLAQGDAVTGLAQSSVAVAAPRAGTSSGLAAAKEAEDLLRTLRSKQARMRRIEKATSAERDQVQTSCVRRAIAKGDITAQLAEEALATLNRPDPALVQANGGAGDETAYQLGRLRLMAEKMVVVEREAENCVTVERSAVTTTSVEVQVADKRVDGFDADLRPPVGGAPMNGAMIVR